ncbi:MAG TPA: DUF2975 domain-containing protein [Caulobacterales bacterium]|nr:DUF2975 domain-containing protein [Caulobacterales bacterium]
MKALGRGSIASFIRWALGFAWWVLWFCAVCWVIAAVSYAVLLILVANGVVDANILTGGHGEIHVGDTGHFDVTYDDAGGATWPVVVPSLLVGAVAIAGGLVIVWRLRRLFANFSTGEPFHKANADHLRAIWIALLAIEVSRYILMAVTGALLVAFGDDNTHAKFTAHVDLSTWFAILILIVLAEVFREGARLREEQELTI